MWRGQNEQSLKHVWTNNWKLICIVGVMFQCSQNICFSEQILSVNPTGIYFELTRMIPVKTFKCGIEKKLNSNIRKNTFYNGNNGQDKVRNILANFVLLLARIWYCVRRICYLRKMVNLILKNSTTLTNFETIRKI